jgi:leucyl/phenylalanyl-tRNA---protein transferase
LTQDSEVQVGVTSEIGEVMQKCGSLRESSWITPEMEQAYVRLGHEGYALAYEVRRSGALVGGLYGVRVGELFAAESMFHIETDGSKVALVCAVTHQFSTGAALFDVQFVTPHLASMGAYEVPRATYLRLLRNATEREAPAQGRLVRVLGSEAAAPADILPWVAERLNLM